MDGGGGDNVLSTTGNDNRDAVGAARDLLNHDKEEKDKDVFQMLSDMINRDLCHGTAFHEADAGIPLPSSPEL